MGVIVLFFAGLGLFNLVMTSIARMKHPPLGKLHAVEGRTMHLYCIGSGSPTILLEAGLGGDVLYWQTIQPALAKTTRVCAYDRAGIGWSERQPGTRDAETIVRQLHALLNAADVPRPMLMIGASAGGFYVREYIREFPNEVSAVVLLDASSPSQLDELPGSRAWFDGEKQKRPRQLKWEKLKAWTGWQRLEGRCHDDLVKELEPWRAESDAEQCRPEYLGGDLGEFLDFETSGHEAARLISIGDRPLLVMSQDPERSKAGWSADAIAGQPIWNREQEALKALSTRSWRVIARGSPHHVHQARAELVASEVGSLVAFLRGGPTPAWGTTTVK